MVLLKFWPTCHYTAHKLIFQWINVQNPLLYTSTFTQQNEHCKVGHVPLIKFKCIPTGIRLRSCYPRTEYNRRDQCMKQRDLQLVLTILYARLWIKKLCRLGLFVFVIWLKAPNVWSLRKLVYIIYLANEESPPSNCYKITWITNFFPIHYPNQPLFVNNKRRKKKKRTGALLLGLILLFVM